MKKYNILVTGVGAIIGYGIVQALRKNRFEVHVHGMDMFSDAVGQRWCDSFVQCPPASDSGYVAFLRDLMLEKQIDLVMFGVEAEVQVLASYARQLPLDSRQLVLNDPDLIRLAQDKWEFYNFLDQHGLNAIPSAVAGEYRLMAEKLGIPFLLKPRSSSASKGQAVIFSEADYVYWKNKTGKGFMVQEIIGDEEHEYTVGVFGLGQGDFVNPIALRRKLGRDGSTVKAEVVNHPDLMAESRKIMGMLKAVGPTNLQFRLHKNKFYLLEINPRFSSSLSLRAAFGFNEPEMCIEYYLEGKLPAARTLRPGRAVRYIADDVIYL